MSGRGLSSPNVAGARRLKASINHDKSSIIRKTSFCVSEPLSEGVGLGATYAVDRRLIGKFLVDFLLVITKLFSRCYG